MHTPHANLTFAPQLSARRHWRPLALAVATLCAAGVSLGASAEVRTSGWTGIGTNDNWSNAFNWSGLTPPISNLEDSYVTFGESVGARTGVDLNADWTVTGVGFKADGFGIEQSFEIFSSSGSTLTLGSGGIQNLTERDQTIEVDVVVGAVQGWDAAEGDIIMRGRRLGSEKLVIMSTTQGNGPEPTHTVFLGGDGSQHTGDILLQAGTMRIGNVDAISATTTVIVGARGIFDLFNTPEVIGGLASEDGSLTDFDGRGTIALGTSGALTFGVNHRDTRLLGHFTGGAGATVIKDGNGTTILETGNSSGYLGRFEVRRGTLLLGFGDNIGPASAVTLLPGATLGIRGDGEDIGSLAGAGLVELVGQDIRVGGNDTSTILTGAITGTGNFFKAGRGVMTLKGGDKSVQDLPYESGANTFRGSVTVLAGTLELGLGDVLTNDHAVTVNAGATLRLVDDDEAFGSLAGAGTVALNFQHLSVGHDNASTTFSGILDNAGDFTKVGTGTLRLTGNNKLVGSVTVAAGVLELGLGDTLTNRSALTVAAHALLRVTGDDENLGGLAGHGDVELERSLGVGFDDSSSSFDGGLHGAGGFTKAGRGLFSYSGRAEYGGRTTVTGGTLQLLDHALLQDGGGRIGERHDLAAHVLVQDRAQWLVDGDVDIGLTGPALLRVEDQGEVYVGGTMQVGREGVVSLAGGSLAAEAVTLTGGALDLEGGRLQFGAFTGDLHNLAGTLTSSSSPRTSIIFGDYTQGADATLEVELAGIPLFQVTGGDVQLGGRLVVNLLSGLLPNIGTKFTILETDGDILGMFAEVVLPTLDGRHLVLDRSNREIAVRVLDGTAGTPAPVPLPPGAALMGGVVLALALRARRV